MRISGLQSRKGLSWIRIPRIRSRRILGLAAGIAALAITVALTLIAVAAGNSPPKAGAPPRSSMAPIASASARTHPASTMVATCKPPALATATNSAKPGLAILRTAGYRIVKGKSVFTPDEGIPCLFVTVLRNGQGVYVDFDSEFGVGYIGNGHSYCDIDANGVANQLKLGTGALRHTETASFRWSTYGNARRYLIRSGTTTVAECYPS